ncbi:S8 family serine peptidase [Methylococcus sp. ANG]
MAGIAAGRDTAGTGQATNGIAKEGSIVAVQVFTRIDDDTLCNNRSPCVLAYTSDVLAGLNWVFSNLAGLSDKTKIASVNLSLGGGKYTDYCDGHPLKPIVDNLRSAGVATVIAAGNDGYVDAVASPGCISTAATVGSSAKQDGISWFSNMASMVDLLGSGIVSSVPDSAYQSLNGTSMATPHVAGAFAAIRSRLPNATVAQIEAALKSTGLAIADKRASAPQTPKPRIQVDQALATQGVVRRSLTVNRTDSGFITSEPAGIDCGNTCAAEFPDKTPVVLTAIGGTTVAFTG